MTEENAKKIIERKERMMTIALILIGIGCLMFLLGMSNIIFSQIGGILFLTGACIGVIARESKKYKAAEEYMEKKFREEKAKLKATPKRKMFVCDSGDIKNEQIKAIRNDIIQEITEKPSVENSNNVKSAVNDKSNERQTTEYLDDITFIKDMRHFELNVWHQYDILLDAQGYGWEYMIEWADYMTEVDLKNISEVTAGGENVTESYRCNGSKCSQTPELNAECRNLSVAGISDVLRMPMKIVWFNQTRILRFFTLINDEMLIRRYAESVARRNFGTADAMKLGKPIPHDN